MEERRETATLLPQETGGYLERIRKYIKDFQEGENIMNNCNCNKKYRIGLYLKQKV